MNEGKYMHDLARTLFPLNRSLTGDGVRETLRVIQKEIPITIREVKSGTKIFDWRVPDEWNVHDAYIKDERGHKVVDFKKNNLHLVSYSVPVNRSMTLADLQKHLYSLPEQPDAIPYVTSYYRKRWGFCISHLQRKQLKEGKYHVVIDASLKKGKLTYGDLVLPGASKKEVFFSTYICHPSMANNELSGPVLAVALARYVMKKRRHYTYRFVFVPETIGAIMYVSKNVRKLRRNVIAGFNLTCVGDERMFSFMPSRYGTTPADNVARRVLGLMHPKYIEWSFLERGSDERQYCSALVDLPFVSIMRSRYGKYPEYHTSHDNLTLVTPRGLQVSFDVHRACIDLLERSPRYITTIACEPRLGPRGLFTYESRLKISKRTQIVGDVLAYADGTNSVEDLSRLIKQSVADIRPVMKILLKLKLLKEV